MSDSYNDDMIDRSEHHDEPDETSSPVGLDGQFDEIGVDAPASEDVSSGDDFADDEQSVSAEADVTASGDDPVAEESSAPITPVDMPETAISDQATAADELDDITPHEEDVAVQEMSISIEPINTPFADTAMPGEPLAAVGSEDIPSAETVTAQEIPATIEPPAVPVEEAVMNEWRSADAEPVAAPAEELVLADQPPAKSEPEDISAHNADITNPPASSHEPVAAPQPRLTDTERAALDEMAAGSGAHARQARIILDWASCLDAVQIAGRLKLSENTVARNIRAFEAGRMDAFTKAPTRRGRKGAVSTTAQASVRITVEDLCRQHDVDMRHATHVAELAHQLFALTLPLHQLDERYLDVIYVAGLLHNVAYTSDPKKHHTRGRDILLATPLSNISDADRGIIAVATAFHRKAWSQDRLQKEKSYAALPSATQQVALWLSAILRIADGLDYSQSQSTGLTESMIDKDICLIGVKGPHDKIDRARANTKADMWRAITGISLTVGSRKDVRQALRRRMTHRPEPAIVSPSGSMSETGRALLHFHLQRMLYHEPGVRSGLSSEPVHDMRVAVRRMWSALDVFGGAYKGKTRRWIARELRVLEDVLGGVRDLDVNIAQAETYLETLPWEARPDLEQMIIDWKDLRENNRSRLMRYLDSSKYAEFAERMLSFCETPEAELAKSAGSSSAIAVGHAAPAIIYTRYEAVRAYEPVIAEVPIATLHEVRAETKRMRYVLEFFRDALGPEARDLIELFVRVQNHLGALQDADIACMLIQKYVKREVKKARQESRDGEAGDISTRLYGTNAYLDSRQNQIEAARKSFGPLWAEVISVETRQMFARTVGAL